MTMEKFTARCIADTTIDGVNVGDIYHVEHDINYKVIYNETDTTFESVVGNAEWFIEHFKRCEEI